MISAEKCGEYCSWINGMKIMEKTISKKNSAEFLLCVYLCNRNR